MHANRLMLSDLPIPPDHVSLVSSALTVSPLSASPGSGPLQADAGARSAPTSGGRNEPILACGTAGCCWCAICTSAMEHYVEDASRPIMRACSPAWPGAISAAIKACFGVAALMGSDG